MVIAREWNDRSNPPRAASRPEAAADRRIFSRYPKIPRFARDSAWHWIATLPRIKSGVARNGGKRRWGEELQVAGTPRIPEWVVAVNLAQP